jgi:methionine-rich copper-binding protein CopC
MWLNTDDFPANASTTGQLHVGSAANGLFERGFDQDWFAIDLVAGTKYLFGLTETTGYVPFDMGYAAFGIQVFDANGKPVSALQSGDELDRAALEFDAPATGTYYVAATSLYRWDGLGGYALSAGIRTGADDFAPNASTSGVLVPGGRVEGRFEVPGDHDWFKIHLDPLTYYKFSSLSPAPGTPYVTDYPASSIWLVDASGRPFPMSQGGFEPNVSGDYYLDVLGLSAADRHYTVISNMWHDDYMDDATTTGRLTPGQQVNATIDFESDVDSFKVSLQASSFYNIDLTGTPDYYTILIVDANGVQQDYTSGNDFNGALRLAFHAQSGGDYYVHVMRNLTVQYFTGTDPYTLHLSKAVADDVGDTPASATAIPVDTSVNAVLQAHDDIDVFRVTLHAGTRYAFGLDANGAANPYQDLRLTKANGDVIDAASAHLLDPTSGLDHWVVFTAPADGDYYLNVVTGSGGAQPYTLTTRTLTGDTTGPSLTGSNPAGGATGLALTTHKIEVDFSEPIVINKSQIVLTDAAGNAVPEVYISTANNYPMTRGTSLQIQTLGNLQPGTYTLSLPHSGIHDFAGNEYTGPTSLSFSTLTPASQPSQGNDVLAGGGGVALDGGQGIDAVAYAGYEYAYTVKRDGTHVTVTDGTSGKTDTLVNIERLIFHDRVLALDVDGNGGQAYRLYQAAFHRYPDAEGLGYWIGRLDQGISLHDVASAFIGSDEFQYDYGQAQSDAEFITLLYNNVLHRAPDDAGLQYWEQAMRNGFSHEDTLVRFSESAENQAAVATVIGNGFSYTPY